MRGRTHQRLVGRIVALLLLVADRAPPVAMGQRQENGTPDWIIKTIEREVELRRLAARTSGATWRGAWLKLWGAAAAPGTC
jgi:hypothetical protein